MGKNYDLCIVILMWKEDSSIKIPEINHPFSLIIGFLFIYYFGEAVTFLFFFQMGTRFFRSALNGDTAKIYSCKTA